MNLTTRQPDNNNSDIEANNLAAGLDAQVAKLIKQEAKERVVDDLTQKLINIHGRDGLYLGLSKLLGYDHEVPSIQKFLNDDAYLGKTIGTSIYPTWRAALYELFPNPFYSPYSEVIATGAIGIGKTTLGKIGCLYDLYRICMMGNPQRHFKLTPTTKIAYAIMNVTLDLAGGVVYDEIKELMVLSPAFSALLNKAGKNTELPKNVHIIVGSRVGHTLGMAIIGAILDEVNFQNKIANQIKDTYNSIKARIESRFLMPGGSFLGRMWMLSSKRMNTDFLDQRTQEALNEDTTKVYDLPIWEIQKHKIKYCGNTFKVFIGDGSRDPKLLTGPNGTLGYDDTFIIDVPTEYLRRFETDIFVALRDLAGVSTVTAHRFISSVEAVEQCLVVPNPIKKEIIELDFWDRSEKLLNYVDVEKLWFKQYRFSPRYIHIDMAKNGDLMGIASSFVSQAISIERFDPVTMTKSKVMEPQFITEFVIPIAAKSGSEIPFNKIKEFIIDLNSMKFPLGGISFDLDQMSTNMRQDLRLLGFTAEYQSVDRTKNAYFTLKNSIIERRWIGPKCPILSKEIKNLVDVGSKIDHPLNGCFTGDTPVRIFLDGEDVNIKISQLVGRTENIRSYNLSQRALEVESMKNCRITKETDTLVKVSLDDSTSYKCTPDHRWLLANGEYKEAKNLVKGDYLQGFLPNLVIDIPNNIKVISVTPLKLDAPVPVYDLEAPINSNFMLGNGVIVHNSKDCADSVAGSIYAAYLQYNRFPGVMAALADHNEKTVTNNGWHPTFS